MADDVMKFPDTWEEFEKHFGFNDIKRAYMFGNTRLIPSFRVQQWLNHIDDIKRKKQLQKNKMEAIAALFGKRLCEEFSVSVPRYEFGKVKERVIVKGWFGSRGFQSEQVIISDSHIFAQLLEGEAVIIDEIRDCATIKERGEG